MVALYVGPRTASASNHRTWGQLMSQPPCHIRLEFRFPGEGEDSPRIVIRHLPGGEIAHIPTDEEVPRVPLPDASVASIDARDAIEHGHDEQAWLAELARVMAPGGELLVRVPLDNGTAWLDALNIYRYLSDLAAGGSGDPPLESLPTGWHRHYRVDAISELIEAAGFEIQAVETEGMPLGELGHLAGLVASGLAPDARATQRRLFDLRERLHHRPLMPLPRALASRITVRATKRLLGPEGQPACHPQHSPPTVDPELLSG